MQPIRALEARLVHIARTIEAVRVISGNINLRADIPLLPAGLLGVLFWPLAIVGPFTGTLAGISAGCAMLSLSIPAYVLARRLGWSAVAALATPWFFPVIVLRNTELGLGDNTTRGNHLARYVRTRPVRFLDWLAAEWKNADQLRGTPMTEETKHCPFCELSSERIVQESNGGVAIRDKFPIANGHTLVIPRQHVASIYELPEGHQNSLWKLVTLVRSFLIAEFQPAGFNIGVNDGAAAGQTVLHAHIHVIPRYAGDVEDPRGGIRWVVRHSAVYWD